MGEVYLARHRHLGTMAALKILSTSLTREPKFRERFFQEAQTQAQLVHPHLARVIDFIEQDGLFCQVVEYLPGGTVADTLQDRRPVPFPIALRCIKQILSALEYAHSKGIVHRDIKPSNILLDEAGNAKLTDFGIALVLGQRRFTTIGKTIGTPEYMSPEQISTPKAVDSRSDIYSMGIVLFELITGCLPFQGGSDFEICQAQVKQSTPNVRRLNPSVSPEIEEVVLKAMQKKPARRYQSCAEFLAALELIDHEPIPVTRLAGVRATAHLRRGRIITVSVVLAILAVSLATYLIVRSRIEVNEGGANAFVERPEKRREIETSEAPFQERLLARIPEKDLERYIYPQFSLTGDRVAHQTNDSGGQRIVVNGTRLPNFETVYGFQINPKTNRIVYYASQGKRFLVMIDDEKIAEFETVPRRLLPWKSLIPVESPEISPDGKKLLYSAPKKGRVHLIAAEWQGPFFDDVWDYQFSRDGSSIAYAARQGSQSFVVLRDWKGPTFDHVYSLQLSSSGSKAAYIAMRRGKSIVVSGEWKSPEYDSVSSLSLSRDGGRVTYVAKLGNKDYVVLDGAIVGETERIQKREKRESLMNVYETLNGIQWAGFSPDGSHHLFVLKQDGKAAYILDGKSGASFDEVRDPAFSPDSTSLAYCAKLGDEWSLVCGDFRSPSFLGVWAPQFTADGAKVGYGARIGNELWWKVLAVK